MNRISTKGWVGICFGVGVVVLIVVFAVAGATGGLTPRGELPQSCYDAQNAESIADDPNQSDHAQQVASLEYAAKQAECEADGGEVPGD